jgi:hypothetical protein
MSSALVTLLNDGPRNVVCHVYIEGDAGGDLTDEVLIDPAADVDPAMPQRPGLTLQAFWADFIGFDGLLEFEELASDRQLWTITGDQLAQADFRSFGGLKDRSSLNDGTGKLMLTTSGLSTGDKGTIILWLRKD